MTRIMFPFLLLVALAAQAMGVLNASQSLRRAGAGVDVFQPRLGWIRRRARACGWGRRCTFRASKAWRSAWCWAARCNCAGSCRACISLGYRFRAGVRLVAIPGLQRILRLMVPAILGNAAVQINVMVNTNFASTISDPVRGLDGPVSWLSYAFRFMQLPLGLFGVAMASATLPSISRSAAARQHGRVPPDVLEIAGDGISADAAVFGGADGAGKVDYRRDLSGRKFQLYDTQQTARGAVLLRDRPDGLRGAEGAEPGVLCAGRRAHADAGEPGFDPDQLRGGSHDDPHSPG